jgi:hypothetical protein
VFHADHDPSGIVPASPVLMAAAVSRDLAGAMAEKKDLIAFSIFLLRSFL